MKHCPKPTIPTRKELAWAGRGLDVALHTGKIRGGPCCAWCSGLLGEPGHSQGGDRGSGVRRSTD
jgi:hypothetical protein